MSGLRIHHPTLRNGTLIISHPGTPSEGRKPKDIHVRIDNEGDSIVSETVWKHLQEARQSGLSEHAFILMNEVLHPPTLVIGWGQTDQTRIYKQVKDIAQEFAPDGVVPRITEKDN